MSAIFKHWVPEWLARTVIFSVLMSSLLGFGLYYSNAESAIGYYGIEPGDVQFSVVLMYASGVSFLALDFRIVKYIKSRKYLLMGLALNAISYLICFYTKNWGLFLICRFVQGMVCSTLCSITLNMIFPRLQATRARVIGYTVFYGGLQISIPICAIYCTAMLHYYEFNWLFYGLNLLQLPVMLGVLITMNAHGRFQKKIPLYQVDWTGYLYYTAFCVLIGYILVYGQQLNWLDSPLIVAACIICAVLMVLFVIRENRIKRPLIDLRVFRSTKFIVGLLLLLAFYIFKGVTGLAYGYVGTILGTDPLHVVPIWIASIAGICLSMFITARLILMGVPVVRIIFAGFLMLLVFYVYMLLMVSVTGDTHDFILPLFIHGAATGVLFVPCVVYTASNVPPKLIFNVAFVGIFARFTGFCISIAVNNYVPLQARAMARERMRASITDVNPQLPLTLNHIQQAYGGDAYMGKTLTSAGFDHLLKTQITARSIRDYYDMMLIGLLIFLLVFIFSGAAFLKRRPDNV